MRVLPDCTSKDLGSKVVEVGNKYFTVRHFYTRFMPASQEKQAQFYDALRTYCHVRHNYFLTYFKTHISPVRPRTTTGKG